MDGKTILCACGVVVLCSCQNGIRSGGHWVPGTHKLKTEVRFNGMARTYRLHIPPGFDGSKRPLLVVLHGAFSTARKIERETGFSELADREGFLVAYPNGIGLLGLLQHWNAGHCCGKAVKDGVDDVAYLDAVIAGAVAACPVDEAAIFLVGHSNGGMMAHRYAAERPGRIAGAAVVAGAIGSASPGIAPWKPPRPERPVPMLIMHGLADPAVPPGGGESPLKANGVAYASVRAAEAFWADANGEGAPVRLVLLDGWGHDWPGPFFTDRAGAPEALRGYDAAAVLWAFFRAAME